MALQVQRCRRVIVDAKKSSFFSFRNKSSLKLIDLRNVTTKKERLSHRIHRTFQALFLNENNPVKSTLPFLEQSMV